MISKISGREILNSQEYKKLALKFGIKTGNVRKTILFMDVNDAVLVLQEYYATGSQEAKNNEEFTAQDRLTVKNELLDIACSMSQQLNDICEADDVGKTSKTNTKAILDEWDAKYREFTKIGGV